MNASYDKAFENVFVWEEPYQIYLTWKAGYTMYLPNVQVIWHNWDRSYRPTFYYDALKFSKAKLKKLNSSSKLISMDSAAEGDRIRRIIYADKEFIRYID